MGAPIVSSQPVGLGACGHGVPAVCVGSVQPIARSKPQERPPASDPLKSPTAPVQTKPVPQAQEPNQRLTQSPSSFTIKAPGNAPTRLPVGCVAGWSASNLPEFGSPHFFLFHLLLFCFLGGCPGLQRGPSVRPPPRPPDPPRPGKPGDKPTNKPLRCYSTTARSAGTYSV